VKALEFTFNTATDKWLYDAAYAPVQNNVLIDGELYNVYTVLYNEVLAAADGEPTATPQSLQKVRLSGRVDFQDGQYCVVEQGKKTPIGTFTNHQVDVIVTAYAIQADHFTLEEAYKAYQGQWGATEGVKMVNAATEEELLKAIREATSETYITFTGKADEPEIAIDSTMPHIVIDGGTFDGQFFVTGKLTLKNMTITNENASSDGISKKKDNAIYVQGEGEVICENVTFNVKKGTGITSWWSSASTNPDAKWNNVVVKNCVFNCNGNRPLQIEGNATIEGCTFNDPYRYTAQLTCGDVLSEKVVINYKNNTINQSKTSGKPTYGLQLTCDYGNCNMLINGAGNKIVDKGDDDALYIFETGTGVSDGTVDIDTITFNITDGSLYQLDGDTKTLYVKP